MNATAEMLEARLALAARLHAMELVLARDEHARAAAALLRGKIHQLGNAVQIVQLSAMELERRTNAPELAELVHDLREGADQAVAVLGEMLAAAAPSGPRSTPGVEVAPVLRAAVERARAAIAAHVELACELADDRTLATADELDALVIAALLDSADAGATRITLLARPRTIAGKPFVQLLFADDRREPDAAILPALVDALARAASGEASRDPRELAVELGTLSPLST